MSDSAPIADKNVLGETCYESINQFGNTNMYDSLRCVTVFIPTYKNNELILGCVNSCLSQTYKNIRVVVIDNGFNECGDVLRKELTKFKDQRIFYRPNTSNIGSQGSFNLIFSLAQVTSRFIAIPADMFLAKDCIEKMVAVAEKTPSANMVYARAAYRDIRCNELAAEINLEDKIYPWAHRNCGPMSSKKMIKLFYSLDNNLDSEWSHFSFIGALIDSSLIRSIAMSRYPLFDHGLEELISLTILSYSEDVVILNDPLLIHYTNAKRLGSAVRSGFNFTRYEPLYAEYYYLETYEPLLIRRGMLLSELYLYLIVKTVYTMARYPGPVYLLAPKAINACLRLLLCIIPVELGGYIIKKIKSLKLRRDPRN
jgi:GT2 family glycosyltransferase